MIEDWGQEKGCRPGGSHKGLNSRAGPKPAEGRVRNPYLGEPMTSQGHRQSCIQRHKTITVGS